MSEAEFRSSFSETPKDGLWYQLPTRNKKFQQYIAWDHNQWKYMILQDKIPVETGYVNDGTELWI